MILNSIQCTKKNWNFLVDFILMQGFRRPMLFLIFISDLPDGINYQLDIYADDIMIYSCLCSQSGWSDKLILATDLVKDIQSVVNWSKKWFVNFNASKTKQYTFNNHRKRFLSAISMADAKLQESNTLDLLVFAFSLTWSWVIILNQLLCLMFFFWSTFLLVRILSAHFKIYHSSV